MTAQYYSAGVHLCPALQPGLAVVEDAEHAGHHLAGVVRQVQAHHRLLVTWRLLARPHQPRAQHLGQSEISIVV